MLKWANYPESEATWAGEEDFENCSEVLEEFLQREKEKGKKKRGRKSKNHQQQPEKRQKKEPKESVIAKIPKVNLIRVYWLIASFK